MSKRTPETKRNLQQQAGTKPAFQVTDRRFWVADEAAVEKASIPDPRYPSLVAELQARTELAERKLKDKVQQLDEENEAFRARLSREMEKRLQQQKLVFIGDFLELVDNFERALKTGDSVNPEDLKQGIRLNLDLFLDKLRALEVEPIELLHQPFNPHQAEAVEVVSVDDPALDQKVIEVIQQGYRQGDRLLRPARVRIGRFEGSPPAATAEEDPIPSI